MVGKINVGDYLTAEEINKKIINPLNELGDDDSEIVGSIFINSRKNICKFKGIDLILGDLRLSTPSQSVTDDASYIVALQKLHTITTDVITINNITLLGDDVGKTYPVNPIIFVNYKTVLKIIILNGQLNVHILTGPSGFNGLDSPNGDRGEIGDIQTVSDDHNLMFNTGFKIQQSKYMPWRKNNSPDTNEVYICDGYYNFGHKCPEEYEVNINNDQGSIVLNSTMVTQKESANTHFSSGLCHPIHNVIASRLIHDDGDWYFSMGFKSTISGKYDVLFYFGRSNGSQLVAKRSFTYDTSLYEDTNGIMPVYIQVGLSPESIIGNIDYKLDQSNSRGMMVQIAPTGAASSEWVNLTSGDTESVIKTTSGMTPVKLPLSVDAVRYMELGGKVEIFSPALSKRGFIQQYFPTGDEDILNQYMQAKMDSNLDKVRSKVYYEVIISSANTDYSGGYLRGVSNNLGELKGDGLIWTRFTMPKLDKHYAIRFEVNDGKRNSDKAPFKAYRTWTTSAASASTSTIEATDKNILLATGDSRDHYLYGCNIRSKIDKAQTGYCVYSLIAGSLYSEIEEHHIVCDARIL